MQFSHQILSVTEETLLHKRFVMAAIHPANDVAQKHILLSCLADYIGYNEVSIISYIIYIVSFFFFFKFIIIVLNCMP